MQLARPKHEGHFRSEVLCYLAICLASVTLGGCGARGPQRVSVAGTVTVDGQPLKSGTVQFIPTSQTKGPSASAMVTNGQFKLNSSDGPLAGVLRVEIIVHKELGFAIDDDAAFADASKNGQVAISPTSSAVVFRDPARQQLELKANTTDLNFDLVSQKAITFGG